MTKLGRLLLTLALLAPVVAQAQTQSDINRQAKASFDAADRKLNAAYVALMSAASPSGKTRLRTAQRAWLQFRDADCEARAGSRGGSFHPAAILMCQASLTTERTGALRQALRCEGGDLSCGGVQEP